MLSALIDDSVGSHCNGRESILRPAKFQRKENSLGKGDPKKDEINIVAVDEEGRMRENAQVENLSDMDNEAQLIDLLNRPQPEVVVVGGYTISATDLAQESLHPWSDSGQEEMRDEQAYDVPVVYMMNDVAWLFQHSKRSDEEIKGIAWVLRSTLKEFADHLLCRVHRRFRS